jgi:hypothetical protein
LFSVNSALFNCAYLYDFSIGFEKKMFEDTKGVIRIRLAPGQWFSPGTPISSTNKIDCHDITDALLKIAINTISHQPPSRTNSFGCCFGTEYTSPERVYNFTS